jgi:flagellin
MLSINTNTSALQALQTLSATQTDLKNTESQVSSGLKVSSALDNGSTFAVAQGMRQTIGAYDSVNSSLGNATSLIAVTTSAVTSMSNLMGNLQNTLVSLSDNSLSADQRSIYTDNVASMITQLDNYCTSATYNGNSLITGAAGTAITFTSNTTGSTFTVRGQAVSTAAGTLSAAMPTTASITAATAQSFLAAGGAVATMNSVLNMALGQLGSDNNSANQMISLNTDLQSAITTGLGTAVDADLSKASANLTALQTKQQLGVQALSIANQSSSIILSLFR